MATEYILNWRKIRDYFDRIGLTLDVMKIATGLSKSHLVLIRTGKRPDIRISTLSKLAFAMNCHPCELLLDVEDGEADPNRPKRDHVHSPRKRGKKWVSQDFADLLMKTGIEMGNEAKTKAESAALALVEIIEQLRDRVAELEEELDEERPARKGKADYSDVSQSRQRR